MASDMCSSMRSWEVGDTVYVVRGYSHSGDGSYQEFPFKSEAGAKEWIGEGKPSYRYASYSLHPTPRSKCCASCFHTLDEKGICPPCDGVAAFYGWGRHAAPKCECAEFEVVENGNEKVYGIDGMKTLQIKHTCGWARP